MQIFVFKLNFLLRVLEKRILDPNNILASIDLLTKELLTPYKILPNSIMVFFRLINKRMRTSVHLGNGNGDFHARGPSSRCWQATGSVCPKAHPIVMR